MKYFIVSDIHAQYDLLINALQHAGFKQTDKTHILIIAGDVLDRGQQGDLLIRFLEELIMEDRLLGVIGNHDTFLIDILQGEINLSRIQWNIKVNGFYESLLLGDSELKKDFELTEQDIEKFRDNFIKKYRDFCRWLLHLPTYLEFKNHVIVHAFLDFSLKNWRDTDPHYAVWERRYKETIPEDFRKNLIFGHTPNYHINGQNEIIINDRKIMIDGGAASGRQVNVLCLDDTEI